MSHTGRAALILSLLAVLVSFWVTDRVFEQMAHLEDEMAYLWQAQAIAGGRLTLPSPPEHPSFLVPFVIDYNGQRFGKYPLGWPVVLAIGVWLGARSLVNPLLAGFGVWLTYQLGKRTFGKTTGLLAAGLTLTSPFFLVNSGSLLSHPLGLVLSAGFAMAWLDAFSDQHYPRPWLPATAAGMTLGVLALTRPLTAVAVALPFGLHGLYLLVRGSWPVRRRVLVVGIVAALIAALHFVWQYAVTGDPFLNPYTLWWEYDKIGFGPGVGVTGNHTLRLAWLNTRHSLMTGLSDLFGWGTLSWIFLPFGVLAIFTRHEKRPEINHRAVLIGSVLVSLIVVYMAYWIGSSLFGPRYYYEGLYSATIFSAAGIAWLAGWPVRVCEPWRFYEGRQRYRPQAVTALVALLVSANLIFYTPQRLQGMHGLYEVSRVYLQPFQTPQAQEVTPALVIVHTTGSWIGYGRLLELQDPFLDTPFIFVISRGPRADARVAEHFPDRNIIHYYPEEPYTFYTAPR